jgi:RNA-directed DNA polymerase
VVDMDLEKFFDRVNHDVLMVRVARRVKDKRLLRLIGRYLRAGIMIGGVVHAHAEEGTPQGSPLSPLLSNIILNDLNKELETRGHRVGDRRNDIDSDRADVGVDCDCARRCVGPSLFRRTGAFS